MRILLVGKLPLPPTRWALLESARGLVYGGGVVVSAWWAGFRVMTTLTLGFVTVTISDLVPVVVAWL